MSEQSSCCDAKLSVWCWSHSSEHSSSSFSADRFCLSAVTWMTKQDDKHLPSPSWRKSGVWAWGTKPVGSLGHKGCWEKTFFGKVCQPTHWRWSQQWNSWLVSGKLSACSGYVENYVVFEPCHLMYMHVIIWDTKYIIPNTMLYKEDLKNTSIL